MARLPLVILGDSDFASRAPYTIVYDWFVARIEHRFDLDALDRLQAAGVTWREVQEVLNYRPLLRRHIGAVLQVVGFTDTGRHIAVALIEEEPEDAYLVVSARELDEKESAVITSMFRRDE